MPIAEVTSQRCHHNTTSGGTDTATFTYPATPTAGNLLVVGVATNGGAVISSLPAGWAQAVTASNTTNSYIFYKTAGASEPTVHAFVFNSTTGYKIGTATEYSGIPSPTLDTTASGIATSGTLITASATGLLTDVAEVVFACFAAQGTTQSFSGYTAGLIEISDQSVSGGAVSTAGAITTDVVSLTCEATAATSNVANTVVVATFYSGTPPGDATVGDVTATLENVSLSSTAVKSRAGDVSATLGNVTLASLASLPPRWDLTGSTTGSGTLANKTVGTAFDVTYTAAHAVGGYVVVAIASDNLNTSSASDVSTVTDSAGNVYTRLGVMSSTGTALANASIDLWGAPVTVAITTSTIVTVTFVSSVTSKAIQLVGFATKPGKAVITNVNSVTVGGAADPPSMVTGTIAVGDLVIRAIALETNSATGTATANWSKAPGAASTGAGATTNAAVFVEFIIATATTMTSDPTVSAADNQNVLVTLRQTPKRDATLAVTLDDVTLASAGTVSTPAASLGNVAATLDAVTLSSAAKLAIQASVSAALADIALTTVAKLAIQGTLATTLDPVTSTATGTLPVKATLAKTLDAVTLVSAAKLAIQGNVAVTLDAVALTSVAKLALKATLAVLLEDSTLVSVATLPIKATLAVGLDPVSLSATGAMAPAGATVGNVAVTLDDATLAAGATLPIVGNAAATLANVALTGSGALKLQGAVSSTLAGVTLVGAGKLALKATVAKTLDAVTLSAAAKLAVKGTVATTLGNVTLAATATLPIKATLAATLDAVTSVSAAALPIKANLTSTLDPVSLAAAGVLSSAGATVGAVSSTLDNVTLVAAGKVALKGSLNVGLGNVVLTSQARLSLAGSQTSTLDNVTLSSTAILPIKAAVSLLLQDVLLNSSAGQELLVPSHQNSRFFEFF